MKSSAIIFLFLLMPSLLLAQGISGTWQSASATGFTARNDLTSSVVSNKIYVIGGLDKSTLDNKLEVYDPSTDSWSTPTTTGTLTGRWGASSCVVDGKIYVMGGFNSAKGGVLNVLEVFDPVANTWSVPSIKGIFTGRDDFAASVVGGKIYTFGGSGVAQNSIVSAVDVYDPAANTWSTLTTTGTFTPRWGPTSAIVNGKIYVIGGSDQHGELNTVEVFDPATNSWSTPQTTGTFTARYSLTSSTLDGKIYALGGSTSNADALNTLEVFDPVTNVWSTPKTTGKFTLRAELTSSVVGKSIYVLGGYNDSSTLNINEVFTPSVNAVGEAAPLQISLFPNPTNGIVSIKNIPENTLRVSIMNLLGETMMQLNNPHTSDFTLDLSKLVPGTYYIRFSSANSVVTKAIIKN